MNLCGSAPNIEQAQNQEGPCWSLQPGRGFRIWWQTLPLPPPTGRTHCLLRTLSFSLVPPHPHLPLALQLPRKAMVSIVEILTTQVSNNLASQHCGASVNGAGSRTSTAFLAQVIKRLMTLLWHPMPGETSVPTAPGSIGLGPQSSYWVVAGLSAPYINSFMQETFHTPWRLCSICLRQLSCAQKMIEIFPRSYLQGIVCNSAYNVLGAWHITMRNVLSSMF